MFYKRAAQRIELFWKNVSPDSKQNRVSTSLSTHQVVSSKVTVELSLRADKESKDGDQIPIQFVVRFAGMSTLSFPLDLKLDTRRKERRQRSRLFKGHHSHG